MTQPDKHSPDDLEYLAQLGFEEVPASDADVNDLKNQVRNRVFSYNTGFYFSLVSGIVGMFIGISVFFVFYEPAPDRIRREVESLPEITSEQKAGHEPGLIALDTIQVSTENFVQQSSHPENKPELTNEIVAVDSILPIDGRFDGLSGMAGSSLSEEKIKFIINAPVFYLHDLKITNYSLLYFKRDRFIRTNSATAVGAEKANGENATDNALHLKQEADYFLHEEIADAMLYFKRGQYDRCIQSLNLISTYNNSDVNCDFYRGMCFYRKKNYNKALEFFDLCIGATNNTFLQEAMFYKAVALFESGTKEEAQKIFKSIESDGGFYAAKAAKYSF